MKSTSKSLNVFSFFSGAGFLDLGFEKNGVNISFANEIHQPFRDAYIYSRNKMGLPLPTYGHHLESIEAYISGDRKSFLSNLVEQSKKDALVGFIGGPPCPDFSTGGKNLGHKGDNGRLTKEYIELITLFTPDFFLLENVKGLWKTEKHRIFYYEMKAILEKNGYILTDYLASSLEFGVPQDRDRIMLFGINKCLLTKKEMSNLSKDFDWRMNCKFESFDIPHKSIWPQKEIYQENSIKEYDSSFEEFIELTVQHWFQKNEVYSHPNALNYFQPRKGLAKFQTIMEGDVSRKSFKRLHRWRYSPTTAYGNNEVHLHPYKDRRLSAAEALSIQSLPKEFELPQSMSLTDMFKTIGNGVPFLLSKAIAGSIIEYMNKIIYTREY